MSRVHAALLSAEDAFVHSVQGIKDGGKLDLSAVVALFATARDEEGRQVRCDVNKQALMLKILSSVLLYFIKAAGKAQTLVKAGKKRKGEQDVA